MRGGRRGSPFGWLWGAFAVSTLGTWLAFDAFSMVAILALHSSATRVSLLAAAGLGAGAVVAVPLGPWMERHRKRRVMVAMDGVRFAALASLPACYALGCLSFVQLLAVAVIVGAAGIGFRAASGSCLKSLVASEQLLTANTRLESTTWTATMVGPPLGGALIGVFGPVATVLADAASYLLSALGICAMPGHEPRPVRVGPGRWRRGEVFQGWRCIWEHRQLRALLANAVIFNGLLMATAPLVAVLMLGRLGIAPWQYGLAFAVPCTGGLVGARLARRLTTRYGQARVLRYAGTARVLWPIGLAFTPAGWAGVGFVAMVEFGVITACGVFNPVFATYRLAQIPTDRLARTLTSWTITSKVAIAAFTALWGVLAGIVGVRIALGLAGAIILLTPLLLPAHDRVVSIEARSEELAAA